MIIKEGMLFRHYLGEYVIILSESLDAITRDVIITYKCVLSGENESMLLYHFDDVVDETGKKYGQIHMFEEVLDFEHLKLDYISTKDLVKELVRRVDSPFYDKEHDYISSITNDHSIPISKCFSIARKWTYVDEDDLEHEAFEPLNNLGVFNTREEGFTKLQTLMLEGKNVSDLRVVKTIDYEEVM